MVAKLPIVTACLILLQGSAISAPYDRSTHVAARSSNSHDFSLTKRAPESSFNLGEMGDAISNLAKQVASFVTDESQNLSTSPSDDSDFSKRDSNSNKPTIKKIRSDDTAAAQSSGADDSTQSDSPNDTTVPKEDLVEEASKFLTALKLLPDAVNEEKSTSTSSPDSDFPEKRDETAEAYAGGNSEPASDAMEVFLGHMFSFLSRALDQVLQAKKSPSAPEPGAENSVETSAPEPGAENPVETSATEPGAENPVETSATEPGTGSLATDSPNLGPSFNSTDNASGENPSGLEPGFNHTETAGPTDLEAGFNSTEPAAPGSNSTEPAAPGSNSTELESNHGSAGLEPGFNSTDSESGPGSAPVQPGFNSTSGASGASSTDLEPIPTMLRQPGMNPSKYRSTPIVEQPGVSSATAAPPVETSPDSASDDQTKTVLRIMIRALQEALSRTESPAEKRSLQKRLPDDLVRNLANLWKKDTQTTENKEVYLPPFLRYLKRAEDDEMSTPTSKPAFSKSKNSSRPTSSNSTDSRNGSRIGDDKMNGGGDDENGSDGDDSDMGPGGDGPDMGPGGDDSDMGPGGDDSDMGPGGDDSDMGPGGDDSDMGPGGDDSDMGPGGDDSDMAPGGDDSDMAPGGDDFDMAPGGPGMVPGGPGMAPGGPGMEPGEDTPGMAPGGPGEDGSDMGPGGDMAPGEDGFDMTPGEDGALDAVDTALGDAKRGLFDSNVGGILGGVGGILDGVGEALGGDSTIAGGVLNGVGKALGGSGGDSSGAASTGRPQRGGSGSGGLLGGLGKALAGGLPGLGGL